MRFSRKLAVCAAVGALAIGLIGNQSVSAQEFTIVVGHTGTPALSD